MFTNTKDKRMKKTKLLHPYLPNDAYLPDENEVGKKIIIKTGFFIGQKGKIVVGPYLYPYDEVTIVMEGKRKREIKKRKTSKKCWLVKLDKIDQLYSYNEKDFFYV